MYPLLGLPNRGKIENYVIVKLFCTFFFLTEVVLYCCLQLLFFIHQTTILLFKHKMVYK